MPETVKRWVPTKIDKSGTMRTLCRECQGRCTYDTEAEAQAWIDAVRNSTHNSPDRVKLALGDDPSTAKPLLVDCYAGHFDPCRVYFDL